MTLDLLTLSIITRSIMPLSIMTLGMSLSTMTLSIMTLSITVKKHDTQHKQHSEFRIIFDDCLILNATYADCHVFLGMLSVFMLTAIYAECCVD